MSVYKRFTLIFACFAYIALPLCVLALCALLWLYDPFMFFHKPYFREQTYHSDMRIQARGIIDFTDFDSVILGSSMLENTSAKETSEKLGGKWVNLSLSGSSFEERATLLEYIFKHKSIHSIIYSIDAFTLIQDYPIWQKRNLKIYQPNSMIARYRYYFNKKNIVCALKWSKNPECVGSSKDLETLLQWHLDTQNEFQGFDSWLIGRKQEVSEYLKIFESGRTKHLKSLSKEKMQEYIKKHIFQFVAKNTKTDFYFIIPTHQRFLYKFPADWAYHQGRLPKQFYTEYKEMFIWFVKESAKYPNVKIYGFDDTSYPDIFTNFRDCLHYNVDMNSMQIDAIANGTHILTPENIDEYLQTMENKIKAYDLAPLIREIKEWEANSSKTKSDFTDP